MKITKRQLQRIIKEEVRRLDESTGVVAGFGFGAHGTGIVRQGHRKSRKSTPAEVALHRKRHDRTVKRAPLVQEYALGDDEILLRRAVDSYVDGYMLKMSMNPGDARDRQRVRRQVGDLVAIHLNALLGEGNSK